MRKIFSILAIIILAIILFFYISYNNFVKSGKSISSIKIEQKDLDLISSWESKGYIDINLKTHRVYITSEVWEQSDYQAKEALTLLFARYCAEKNGTDAFDVELCNKQSGQMLTKWKPLVGYTLEKSDFLTNNLAGHIYLATNENIIYSLKFLEDNEVIVSIYGIGVFQQPYTVLDSIIDIKMWKDPFQYKILNEHQLQLIKSPYAYSKKNIMELRK